MSTILDRDQMLKRNPFEKLPVGTVIFGPVRCENCNVVVESRAEVGSHEPDGRATELIFREHPLGLCVKRRHYVHLIVDTLEEGRWL